MLIEELQFKWLRDTARPYSYSLVREARMYVEHHTFKSVSFNSPGSFSAVVLIESVLKNHYYINDLTQSNYLLFSSRKGRFASNQYPCTLIIRGVKL